MIQAKFCNIAILSPTIDVNTHPVHTWNGIDYLMNLVEMNSNSCSSLDENANYDTFSDRIAKLDETRLYICSSIV